jgi:hypothetical protein
MDLLSQFHVERADLVRKNKQKLNMLKSLQNICESKYQSQEVVDAVIAVGLEHAELGHYHTAIVCRDFAKTLVVVDIQGAL